MATCKANGFVGLVLGLISYSRGYMQGEWLCGFGAWADFLLSWLPCQAPGFVGLVLGLISYSRGYPARHLALWVDRLY